MKVRKIGKIQNYGFILILEMAKHQEMDETFDQIVKDMICQLCRGYPKPEDQRWYKCSQLHHICQLCVESKKMDKCSCQGTIVKKVDKMTEALLKLKTLKFKCRHCSGTFIRGDINNHESGCDQRLVPCPNSNFIGPLKCNEMVELDKIWVHCVSIHNPVAVFRNGENCIATVEPSNNGTKSTKLSLLNYCLTPMMIEAYGKVFMRCAVTKDGIYYDWVQLVGPSSEAQNFMFSLEYKGPKSTNVYMGEVAAIDESLEVIIASGKCNCLPFGHFKKQFLEEDLSYTSSVTIKKIGE